MYKRPVGTIYLLKRAELAVRGCMEVVLAEFDLTPAQFLVLFRMRDRTARRSTDDNSHAGLEVEGACRKALERQSARG